MLFLQKIRQCFRRPSVSVLIPAFQSESFICETLDSLSKQVYEDFQIIFSVDKSDDNTEKIIRKWCREHKKISTRIFSQNQHIGWVKNINFLLKQCNTKYFMVMPHDDTLDKKYIQKMCDALIENPRACVAYSDISGFGEYDKDVFQKSVFGNKIERTLDFLNHHFSAVAFRGLINRSVLSDLLLLPENDCSNFAIDTIWNLQMAIKGDLIRIPEILYHKRYHQGSSHSYWQNWDEKEKLRVWVEHCKDCLKVILRGGFEKNELDVLINACISRLFDHTINGWAYKEIMNLNQNEKYSLVADLQKVVRARDPLQS